MWARQFVSGRHDTCANGTPANWVNWPAFSTLAPQRLRRHVPKAGRLGSSQNGHAAERRLGGLRADRWPRKGGVVHQHIMETGANCGSDSSAPSPGNSHQYHSSEDTAFSLVQNQTYLLRHLARWFQKYKAFLTFQDFPCLLGGSTGEDLGNVSADFSVRAGHLLASDHTDAQTVAWCLVEHFTFQCTFFHMN